MSSRTFTVTQSTPPSHKATKVARVAGGLTGGTAALVGLGCLLCPPGTPLVVACVAVAYIGAVGTTIAVTVGVGAQVGAEVAEGGLKAYMRRLDRRLGVTVATPCYK